MDIDKTLRDFEARLLKIEQALFGGRKERSVRASVSNFKGATGGLRRLVAEGFFNRKRTFGEVTEALANHGYHYSKQAVQTPLNTLSKSGSLLVSFREKGRKVYAKRK